ncbi:MULTISPECIES: PA4780 family RIO1-like protein kinase [unclassified Wenzhouxiangella]|uniref:PA4780 family RIO1-like protein kinase n=1 Tax=unclassified Wenzhouxiangella TaxID=2613841 RepID=UPI000E32CFF5|nr:MULTISPECIES: PA4780 family RIO1-like protein kinase [unclassified Wenzhouxiangella]RFF26974.1 serine protein kinase RIO [Wenzhouxiangella sp. 15181]RFP69486.1 serine protein kinase RIO [Wenzhouxiangella sp. 15190]
MKIPARLKPLAEDGLIDEVLRPLKSGKEADVFVVRCGDEKRCAKVFKEANVRSFKQAAQYQEGRNVRNSRRARAMNKRTRYGQKEQEKEWLNAEVDALYRLSAAGVRVPRPHGFVDGVLLMELIIDSGGNVAPRLDAMKLSAEQAREYHSRIIAEIVRMLAAGLIHGDLSEFNVLVDNAGPVIIDLPQAVNAAANNSAAMMLVRDVDRMKHYFGRFAPELLKTEYGKEMWSRYASGNLDTERPLTGAYQPSSQDVNLDELMGIIDAAREEEKERLERISEEASGEPGDY